ncbi:UNVERIFIED_CONTAM: hypothetical protein HDU68_009655 [Siphonaria sp. JEL0065]|nr:hypothetical protein HDU68_009655 [Siphonaria sp. JEL0065]
MSKIIRLSITAGDLVRGRISFVQMGDFWVWGTNSPAYKVTTTTKRVETGAICILIASSMFFSWVDIQTKLLRGNCQPAVYDNATLPEGIDLRNYVQGDIDYAEVYNYGLPLADGLVGGWAGWPMNNPMKSFLISGDGPVYVLQVLCDGGVPRPDLDYGILTHVQSRIISEDDRGFMLQITVTFPTNSVYDDVRETYVNSSVVQDCSLLVTVSHGRVSFKFNADQWAMVTNGQVVDIRSPSNDFYAKKPTSIDQFSTQAHAGFVMHNDKFGVLPILKMSIMELFENSSYAPSQGAAFCNLLSEGTYPDGFYHTGATYRGVTTGVGAAAHFAIMQYSATAASVDCDYYGNNGAGMLSIPSIAIYMSAIGSGIACFMKAFEILWWFMAQNGIELHSYRRARRLLRHPMRFAIEFSETLQTGMGPGERQEDYCDLTTTKIIEEVGNTRLMFGEDIMTRDMDKGHLKLGVYGAVKTIWKDREFGSYRPSDNIEWEDFIWA